MENHYFDAQGIYTGSAAANPGSAPPLNALRTPPPKKTGCWPVVNAEGTGWDLIEDQRGREGFVDGRPVRMDRLGPLPPGWTDQPPPARLHLLTRSGVYHREGCRHAARAGGEWLMPEAIAAAQPAARPCLRCRPPGPGEDA